MLSRLFFKSEIHRQRDKYTRMFWKETLYQTNSLFPVFWLKNHLRNTQCLLFHTFANTWSRNVMGLNQQPYKDKGTNLPVLNNARRWMSGDIISVVSHLTPLIVEGCQRCRPGFCSFVISFASLTSLSFFSVLAK